MRQIEVRAKGFHLRTVLRVVPAADLATRTIEKLTLGMIPAETALILLAVWETVIGLGLLATVATIAYVRLTGGRQA